MIKLKPLLYETRLICEAKVPLISLQQAEDNKLFGPVFHGTSQENLSKIDQEGFKVIVGLHGTSGMSHGYENFPYGVSVAPPPIHHLGFGAYFTTIKNIAKKFSGGTLKGLQIYFLNAPHMEIINWGSTRTMMKWWIENGYDPELSKQGEGGRYMATVKMTDYLKKRYDAVWYKGKGITRLLDGDQVCVYDTSNIYEIDLSLSKGFDVGAKVRAKYRIARINATGGEYDVVEAGARGIIIKKEPIAGKREEFPLYWAKRAEQYVLDVAFKPGGRHHVEDVDVEPINQ